MSALQVINVTAALRVPIPMDLTYVLATAATPETDELVETLMNVLSTLMTVTLMQSAPTHWVHSPVLVTHSLITLATGSTALPTGASMTQSFWLVIPA